MSTQDEIRLFNSRSQGQSMAVLSDTGLLALPMGSEHSGIHVNFFESRERWLFLDEKAACAGLRPTPIPEMLQDIRRQESDCVHAISRHQCGRRGFRMTH